MVLKPVEALPVRSLRPLNGRIGLAYEEKEKSKGLGSVVRTVSHPLKSRVTKRGDNVLSYEDRELSRGVDRDVPIIQLHMDQELLTQPSGVF